MALQMEFLLFFLAQAASATPSDVERREVRCVQAAMIATHYLEKDGELDAVAMTFPVIAFYKGRLLARRPDVDWHTVIKDTSPGELMDNPTLAIRATVNCQNELNEIVSPTRSNPST